MQTVTPAGAARLQALGQSLLYSETVTNRQAVVLTYGYKVKGFYSFLGFYNLLVLLVQFTEELTKEKCFMYVS